MLECRSILSTIVFEYNVLSGLHISTKKVVLSNESRSFLDRQMQLSS